MMRNVSQKPILRFICALVSLLAACPMVWAGGWVAERPDPNPDAELCQPLLERLRSLPQLCARDALETYPEFTSPPWKKLEPGKHLDLLAKLIFYGSGVSRATKLDLDRLRARAREFIDRGGEIRLWHTRLTSSYGDEPAPPGEQTVVMLVDKYGTVNPQAGDCPGQSSKGWLFHTFIVLPDLSGPDLDVDQGFAYVLALKQLVLYHNTPLLLGTQIDYSGDTVDDGAASVWKDYRPAGLRQACSFRFVRNSVRGRKEK